jgi:hypothetical protein
MTEQEIQERLSRRIEEKFPQGEGITAVGLRAVIRDLVRELEGEGVAESIDERVNQLMASFAFAIDGEEG